MRQQLSARRRGDEHAIHPGAWNDGAVIAARQEGSPPSHDGHDGYYSYDMTKSSRLLRVLSGFVVRLSCGRASSRGE
jgi:hypothetical protein